MPAVESAAPDAVRRVLSEDVLTLAEARAEIARVTGRRIRPDKATVFRWIKRGVGGAKLDAVRIGMQWLTSKQAITRFVAARTAADE